ncbi:hypothetical protein NZD88_20765 [Chryseobacterium antibioticum]|uniref:Cell division protein FtsL n=1 Tax=Chryseobacterium pyrolae TaxID=2987481 RepID=A0ABT2IMW6_9FLAO|nr:hypothetical protein [Chryseobacterium pyrolae]MCT2409995.1 hypothetical protein [Chryseobacterium pyrolae]
MEKDTVQPKPEKNAVVEKIKAGKEKAVKYIKEHPKNVLYTMVALTIFSIFSNILYYNYTVKNAKVSYKQMSDKLFNTEDRNIEKKQNVSIVQQAGDYLEMKKDLDKLKEFQNRKNLTKQDTLEIRRITKKYNLR